MIKSTSLRKMNKHNRDLKTFLRYLVNLLLLHLPAQCSGHLLASDKVETVQEVCVLAGVGTGCARAAGDGGGLRGGGGAVLLGPDSWLLSKHLNF